MQQTVSFLNQFDEKIIGRLEMPDTQPARAVALFAHCFTCTKNIRAAKNISKALVDAGIAVMRFDFTGLGESEGDFSVSGFSSNVDDLVRAADFLRDEHGTGPALLIGHSLGGTAALMAAARIDSCVAVATIGAPAQATHVEKHFEQDLAEIREQGVATVNIGGRPFQLRREFIDDLEAQPIEPGLKNLGRALLVLHSPVDTIVGVDEASKIFASARHPKSFISLNKADHLLSKPTDSRYVATVIAAWAEQYLPMAAAAAVDTTGDHVTAVTGSHGFTTRIQAGNHQLIADEPANLGGEDAGPSPYGYLSAALAACTSMTLQMYARRKKIALSSATVTVVHEKIHAEDCEACQTKTGRIDQFNREISLGGEFSDEQRDRLLEIADRCPVHRSLHAEIKVRTRLRTA